MAFQRGIFFRIVVFSFLLFSPVLSGDVKNIGQFAFDPKYNATARDYIVLTDCRSLSHFFVDELKLMGFGAGRELLADHPQSFPAAYRASMRGGPPFSVALGLNALYAHGFPEPRNATTFFGFKGFPSHFQHRPFVPILNDANLTGGYPFKVIHLVRDEYFMASLSLYESASTGVWLVSDTNYKMVRS